MWCERILVVCLAVASLVVPSSGITAEAATVLPPGGTFQDDDGNIHEGNIEAIHAAGVTQGCSPTQYCPTPPLTREQMAAFLDRSLTLPTTAQDHFSDDDSSPFEDSINRVAAAGISLGCAPGRFCPGVAVTRAEMASFLARALALSASPTDHFTDDDGSPFEADIDSLATAGVTLGCDASRYCPQGAVTRAEMASFVARSLGLDPIMPPPRAVDGAIHVNVGHAAASDTNSGTISAPLKSIQAGIDLAATRRKVGEAARVVIAPGVYREHIHIGHSTADSPPLVVEAAQPGTVRVTGTDAMPGWAATGPGIYSRPWPHNWSTASGVSEIVGRREIAFHNGTILRQVLSSTQLQPGTFYVDELADRISVAVAGGLPPIVEVGVRPQALRLDGARNVTIKGLEFSGAATPFQSSSVQITNVSNVALIGNVVRSNSWTGLSIATSDNVVLEGNQLSHNGGGGVGVFRVSGLRMLSNETSHNNWRGAQGDYTGWTIAGVKVVGSHGLTVDRHVSRGNQTRGFWVDYDIANFTVSNSVFCDNLTDGLFIEASQGPSSVSNTTACDNGRYGLLISNGRYVTIQGSRFCGNDVAGIRLDSDGAGGRTINTASGSILLTGAESLTIKQSSFGGTRLLHSNLPSGQWSGFVSSLSSDQNRFSSAGDGAFFFDGRSGSLATWQTATGQDAGSTTGTGC